MKLKSFQVVSSESEDLKLLMKKRLFGLEEENELKKCNQSMEFTKSSEI